MGILLCDCQVSSDSDGLSYFLTFAGIIVTAFVTGFVTLLKIKSNTVSAFRIKWIKNFRSCLSDYLVANDRSLIMFRALIEKQKNYEEEKRRNLEKPDEARLKAAKDEFDKYEDDYDEACYKASTMNYKLRLLLYKDNPIQEKLNTILQEIEDHEGTIFSLTDLHEIKTEIEKLRAKIPGMIDISREIIVEKIRKTRRMFDLD